MSTPQAYRLKFIADDTFVQQLEADATQEREHLKIESAKKDKEATRLGFDLVTVSVVVTIISGTLYTGELATKIIRWWQQSKGNKIIIQGPFQTLELHKSNPLTEEDVRKFLQAAQELQ